MMKRKIAFGLIAMLITLGAYTYLNKSLYTSGSCELNYEWKDVVLTSYEKECLSFLNEKMSEVAGIRTNYLDAKPLEDISVGHEVLSESQGLLMLYAVKGGHRKVFDQQLEVVKRQMTLRNGLIKWRLRSDDPNRIESSASIDDLRIARALFYAYDRWKVGSYKKQLVRLSKAIKSYETKDHMLIDYYDVKARKQASTISLSYIDLKTMGMLSQIDPAWNKIEKNGQNIIKEGYISEKLPLFHGRYDLAKKSYIVQKQLNIIDSLMVLLHLSEVGHCPQRAISWLEEQVLNKGNLYAGYDIQTGEASTSLESTAAYALCAQIARNTKRENLYAASIEKMLRYQVKNTASEIYGSFGDEQKLEVYSFDNLEALLALQDTDI